MASTEGHLTGSSRISTPEGDRRSSDEIRRDIERRRDELDVTTEVLQHRLAPRELAENLWHDVRTWVGSGAGDVAEVVKRHPLPLGLIGAGIAWWVYETSTGRSLSFGNGRHHEEDDLGIGSMSTGSYHSESSWESEGDYPSGSYEGGEEGWRERSKHAVERSTDRLRSGAHAARQGFSEAVDRNPMALGAACFSLGILAGVALPTTRWEDETMGETSSRVGRRAKRAAKDVAVRAAEQGARVAQDAAERVREEAEERATPSDRARGTSPREPVKPAVGSTGSGSYSGSSKPGSPGTGTPSGGRGASPRDTGKAPGPKPETSRTGGERGSGTRDERDPWDTTPGRG